VTGPRAALALAAALTVVAATAGRAGAADECTGLPVCISVPGPWVVVAAPRASAPAPASSWLLRCPEGTIGGLDARLTRPEIDISFAGLLGSPVAPGRTTSNAALFTGAYTGKPALATAYKPFLGCIPAAGGARTPTVFRPGRPTIARARAVPVFAGRAARVTFGCNPGERLISSTRAVGVYGETAPSASELAAVHLESAVRNGRILASATRPALPGRRVELQVVAICSKALEK
jgi:hypothetical protein